MTDTDLKVTPAGEWGLPTHLVKLPSGKVAELRVKLPIYLLLRTGVFTPEIAASFEAAGTTGISDMSKALPLIDAICEGMFIKPKVTRDGAKGTVAIDALDPDDVNHVLTLAFGGTPDAAFPADAVGADGGGDGEDVAGDAVKPARPRARKPRSARN